MGEVHRCDIPDRGEPHDIGKGDERLAPDRLDCHNSGEIPRDERHTKRWRGHALMISSKNNLRSAAPGRTGLSGLFPCAQTKKSSYFTHIHLALTVAGVFFFLCSTPTLDTCTFENIDMGG